MTTPNNGPPTRVRPKREIKPPARYCDEPPPGNRSSTPIRPKRKLKQPARKLKQLPPANTSSPKPRRPKLISPCKPENNSEACKVTKAERQKIEQVGHLRPKECHSAIEEYILQQRAINVAINTELAKDRAGALRIVLATSVLSKRRSKRLEDMERNEFIQELQREYDKVNSKLQKEWMKQGFRADEDDIREDKEFRHVNTDETSEKAEGERRQRKEVKEEANQEEEKGSQEEEEINQEEGDEEFFP